MSTLKQHFNALIACILFSLAMCFLALSSRLVGHPQQIVETNIISFLSLIPLGVMQERFKKAGGFVEAESKIDLNKAKVIRCLFKSFFFPLLVILVVSVAYVLLQPGIPLEGIPLSRASEPFRLNTQPNPMRVSKLRYFSVVICMNINIVLFQLLCAVEVLHVAMFGHSLLGKTPENESGSE